MKKTYTNKNGKPIIRKCSNCIYFKNIDNKQSNGYCKQKPLYFAFTHEKSVYAIVKDFYLCESHAFVNEDILKAESEEVDLQQYLINRNEEKKND